MTAIHAQQVQLLPIASIVQDDAPTSSSSLATELTHLHFTSANELVVAAGARSTLSGAMGSVATFIQSYTISRRPLVLSDAFSSIEGRKKDPTLAMISDEGSTELGSAWHIKNTHRLDLRAPMTPKDSGAMEMDSTTESYDSGTDAGRLLLNLVHTDDGTMRLSLLSQTGKISLEVLNTGPFELARGVSKEIKSPSESCTTDQRTTIVGKRSDIQIAYFPTDPLLFASSPNGLLLLACAVSRHDTSQIIGTASILTLPSEGLRQSSKSASLSSDVILEQRSSDDDAETQDRQQAADAVATALGRTLASTIVRKRHQGDFWIRISDDSPAKGSWRCAGQTDRKIVLRDVRLFGKSLTLHSFLSDRVSICHHQASLGTHFTPPWGCQSGAVPLSDATHQCARRSHGVSQHSRSLDKPSLWWSSSRVLMQSPRSSSSQ